MLRHGGRVSARAQPTRGGAGPVGRGGAVQGLGWGGAERPGAGSRGRCAVRLLLKAFGVLGPASPCFGTGLPAPYLAFRHQRASVPLRGGLFVFCVSEGCSSPAVRGRGISFYWER